MLTCHVKNGVKHDMRIFLNNIHILLFTGVYMRKKYGWCLAKITLLFSTAETNSKIIIISAAKHILLLY